MKTPINKETKKSTKTDLKTEVTGSQTTIGICYGSELMNQDYTTKGTYVQLRAVRRDPTVSLARGLLIACIRAGSWAIEADDDVARDKLDFMKHILALRDDFLYNVVAFGLIDYGWQGFEKIYAERDGRIIIESLKPLLHDITTILVTEQGRFDGYRQRPMYGAESVDLVPDKCFHTAFGVEAGNFYGWPLLADVREACDMWHESNDGARRYDKKIAGSHWVIRYPPGTATVDGETIDNGEIAVTVLNAMESSGSVSIPTTTATVLQELVNEGIADLYGWHVELLSDDSARQESFSKRLTYLDTLKVRGLIMPERAILEGTHGTLAESEVQGDWATNHLESIDRQIAQSVNLQLVDPLVRMNYGDNTVGKIRLVAAPLVDERMAFYREVYKTLNDPKLDIPALADRLDIPQSEGESAGEQNG